MKTPTWWISQQHVQNVIYLLVFSFLLWVGYIKMYFCSFEEKYNSAADRIINIKYEACADLNKSEQLLSTFFRFLL